MIGSPLRGGQVTAALPHRVAEDEALWLLWLWVFCSLATAVYRSAHGRDAGQRGA